MNLHSFITWNELHAATRDDFLQIHIENRRKVTDIISTYPITKREIYGYHYLILRNPWQGEQYW